MRRFGMAAEGVAWRAVMLGLLLAVITQAAAGEPPQETQAAAGEPPQETQAAAGEPPQAEPPAALPPGIDWNAVFRMHYLQRVRAFREENAGLQHVVLLGDSLTEGFDVAARFPGGRFLNRGIGGDVLGVDLAEDDPRGVLRRLPESVYDCRPTDVFILIGINDLNQGRGPDTVERGSRSLLQALRREVPRTRVHLQSLLPTRGGHAEKNPQIVECNRRLAALAAEFGVNYVDLHARFRDPQGQLRADFTEDGLHLTPPAYDVWRDVIDDVLRSQEPPAVPLGLDAYRMWHRWPTQRIGVRGSMRSTYDRTGGNRTADASHFLYQERDDFNVALDVEGRGVLAFARANRWHGSPWHYEVDGVDHVVEETSSADPEHPVADSIFMPEALFPTPLTWTWSTTKGADLTWVPIPFERSFRIGYSRTFYGTGYFIYHLVAEGTPLVSPIAAWDGRTPPDPAVLDLLRRAGTDIAPTDIPAVRGTVALGAGGVVSIGGLPTGPTMIRAVKFSVPRRHAVALGRARLRVTWDGRARPSIDAPVCLMFGAGTLFNRDDREYLVKGLPLSIRYAGERVELSCYFPMPFFSSAAVELVDVPALPGATLDYEIRHEPLDQPANHVGYFHATHHDEPEPRPGHDICLLDTDTVEGGGPWSGSFVGTSFIFTRRGVLSTLEGDPRFFFDDSQTPQAYGTGTEEWGGGGDYWGGLNMTLPLVGHPVGARTPDDALNDEDLVHSAYRFLLADLMPFGRRAVIRLEHGGENESTEHYETVTYWYGLPAASLVPSDDFDVGDPASEAAHAYVSPEAGPPTALTSRYEWGPDTTAGLDGGERIEVFPATTQIGRHTTGTSEFTLAVDDRNVGVLLRRTLDYGFPNQRAEVSIADASPGATATEFERAGIWYLAGSNTFYHSFPRGEADPPHPVVGSSNRRFRDDEFLIPRRLTAGRSAIRVRVRFTPVVRPLLPHLPVPDLAWSELRYRAYSFVMPDFRP